MPEKLLLKLDSSDNLRAKIYYNKSKSTLGLRLEDIDGKLLQGFVLDLNGINRKVISKLNNLVGWGWGDVQKAARRITVKVGVKKLMRQVDRISKDPRFAKGMMAASLIYPPLGITYGAVRASAKLMEQVHAGNTEAQERLLELAELAKEGNAKAILTVKALSALHQAKKKGVDISGWAQKLEAKAPWVYSKHYRTNWEAKELDSKNPFHIVRGLYNLGVSSTNR